MSWINLLDVIYPVGAVYFSVLSTSPASTVGGTWTQLTGGLLGLADSAGIAVAGSNGGSNTITVEELPNHNHELQVGPLGDTAGWDSSGGSDRLQYRGLKPGRNIFEFYSRYTTSTGGGRTLFLHIPLFIAGSVLLNSFGGEQ